MRRWKCGLGFVAWLLVEAALPGQDVAEVRIHPARVAGFLSWDDRHGDDGKQRFRLSASGLFASRFVRPRLRAGEEIVQLGDSVLVALARPRQQEWLQRFLAANDKSYLVELRTQIFEFEAPAFAAFVAPLFRGKAIQASWVVLKSGKKTKAWLAVLQKRRDVRCVQSPKVLATPVQRAQLKIMTRTSFVKDYRPTFDGQGRLSGVEPVSAEVNDGLAIDTTASLLRPGVFGVMVRVSWSRLRRPIAKVAVRFPALKVDGQIGVPELDVSEVRANVRIAEGAWAALLLPKGATKKGRRFVAMISAKAVPVRQEEKR